MRPINNTFRVLAHKLRVNMLKAMVEHDGPMSPIMLAKALDAKLADVSYHMGVLKTAGLVTLKDTVPRRGAVEHFYAPIDGMGDLLADAGKLAERVEKVGV